MPPTKRFAADVLLTLIGVGAALMAFIFSFQLSADVRGELGRIQEEASVARVSSVLQALDQDVQHLADYTLGYAMWDDTYAFVQAPDADYPATNYAEAVLAASPVQLVAIYGQDGRLLFATALDENRKTVAVPAELTDPAFVARFTSPTGAPKSRDALGWVENRPYLLSAWPITDSARTAPPRGTLLFGTLLGRTKLERLAALTGVTVKPGRSTDPQPDLPLELDAPLLGPARVAVGPASDAGHFQATAIFSATGPPAPIAFHLVLPARLSETAQRLNRVVRTDFLLVSAAFVTFAAFAGWEILRRRREGRRLQAARTEAERLAHEAASADRAKSAFLAVMSHEIRTPLNAIIGYAELLKNVPLDPESAQGVQSIRDSGGMLLRVLNDILDFSKIEAGALTIHPEPISVGQLAGEVRTFFDLQAREHGNVLRLEVSPGVPERILVDGNRLKQILSNLISNATKFTHDGEIRISVDADPACSRLRISVEDDGIGITPDQASRLFQAFSQIDSTTARRYDGTGLGLAITRRLCILMGGTIVHHPREPRGARFEVELPYGVPALPPAPPVPSACASPLAVDAPDVLVVDDNAINARLLSATLQRLGVTARIALSGAAAIAHYETRPADLVFMDIQMPEMDGFETTRRIRRLEATKQLRACRIVAVTADILETSHHEAVNAGMDGYLGKPIKPEQIRAAIETLSHAHSPSA